MKQPFFQIACALMVLMLMPLSKMMGQSFQYPEYEEDTVRIAVNYSG